MEMRVDPQQEVRETIPSQPAVENITQSVPNPAKRRWPYFVAFAVGCAAIIAGVTLLFIKGNTTNMKSDTQQANTEQLNTKEPDISSQKEADAISDDKDTEDVSSTWREFTSLEFKVKLPDGWDFVHQDNGVLLVSCDGASSCYELESGVAATVEEVMGGRDGLQGLLVALQAPLTEEYTFDDMTSGFTLQGPVGNGFDLYSMVVTDEPEENLIGLSYPVGTKEYKVVKTFGDGRIGYFGYNVLPDQFDPTETIIPLMVASFEVL